MGPILAGSTTGSVNLVVSQAITLDTDLAIGSNPTTSDADDAVTTRNNEGTNFTVAMELHQNQIVKTQLYLQNASAAAGAATLELNVPSGIDVSLDQISDGTVGLGTVIGEAQLSRSAWLMSVASTAGTGNNDGVELTVRPKADLKPGFYTITGRIIQISG